MGIAKEMMIERQQEEFEHKLADILGITYDELCEVNYEIDFDTHCVEFSDDSSTEILNKIKGLEDEKRVWLQPWVLFDDEEYYDEQYDAIIQNRQFYENFQLEIQNLRKLNELEIEDVALQQILKRQIYIGIVGTLETFLSDTFINLTATNEEYFKNFVKSHPEFKQRKFELREIFEQTEKLKTTAKKIMLDTIYHDLPKVREMYRSTFKIDFPEIKEVIKSVLTRHDLVHRNGKTKDNDIIELDKETVGKVLTKISEFTDEIADKLNLKDIEW